ncbi:cytidylate kinase/GTP-binding protein [Saccharothrix coeruleofusca]|uniref:(d)CMP kinase n=1 Tax=Saccharothrix coeruleofusca TaxID=33919 RepID=UPI001AE43761|nr:(d)CMP kinase [Saccharothrix coeruleofusca]MBP2340147.1 cytidylate kinase/GTP-binding protein [Saccharothrix coeruleofusca]
MDSVVIAVDGPAAAGKTTTCLALSEIFGLQYIESGRTYRILAFEALRRGISPEDRPSVISLCDELIEQSRARSQFAVGGYAPQDLRSAPVNVTVSTVARIAELRVRVTELVRTWAAACAKCVVEGRDIGTVVFPAASIKFYLTATPEVRAGRRIAQEGGGAYEDVLRDVLRRDRADMSREVSPLVPAEDAVMIDTTELPLAQVVDRMVSVCESRGVTIP